MSENVSKGQELIQSVQSELDKSKKDSAKAKLKELLKKKEEAEKALNLINQEISDFIDDYETGRL